MASDNRSVFAHSQAACRAGLPPEALGRFCLWPLQASGGLWLCWACGCNTPVSVFAWPSSLHFFLPLFLIRTLVIGFRDYSDNPWWSHLRSLTWLHLQRPFSPNKVTFSGSGNWIRNQGGGTTISGCCGLGEGWACGTCQPPGEFAAACLSLPLHPTPSLAVQWPPSSLGRCPQLSLPFLASPISSHPSLW